MSNSTEKDNIIEDDDLSIIKKEELMENDDADMDTGEHLVKKEMDDNRDDTTEKKNDDEEILPSQYDVDWSTQNDDKELKDETEKENGDEEKPEQDPLVTEILRAAEKNELEIVRKLLEEDPALVNVTDKDLYTPLHRACYGNHSEVIKVLLSYGANVSARTVDGWEPLHCAAQWDNVEAASLLLHNRANVNAVTKGNLSPLHLAASRPTSRRTLELLLWHPYIDGNLVSDAKDKPYDMARRLGPYAPLFEILDESINIY